MLRRFGRILVLLVLLAVAYLLTVYAQHIRKYISEISLSKGQVKGVSPPDVASNMRTTLQNDIEQKIGTIKEQSMHITLGDIASSAGRLQKFSGDAEGIKNYVQKKIQEYLREQSLWKK